jgi:hypothetical protein
MLNFSKGERKIKRPRRIKTCGTNKRRKVSIKNFMEKFAFSQYLASP